MSHAHSIMPDGPHQTPFAGPPPRFADRHGPGSPFPLRTQPKPVGGYIPITIIQLCLVWWGYLTRHITWWDVQVWFGCRALMETRRHMAPGKTPRYSVPELCRQMGATRQAAVKASLDKLGTLGLLRWSTQAITFAEASGDLAGALQGSPDLSLYDAMLQTIIDTNGHSRRDIPFPRQTLVAIARGHFRKTMVATMLGHLCRCLYRREHQCVNGGRVTTSWIATVFRVDRRAVKAAKQRLLAMGWLEPGPKSAQPILNTDGPWTYINLRWNRHGLTAVGEHCTSVQETPLQKQTPPPLGTSAKTTTPSSNFDLLRSQNHSEPPAAQEPPTPPTPPAHSVTLPPPPRAPDGIDSNLTSHEEGQTPTRITAEVATGVPTNDTPPGRVDRADRVTSRHFTAAMLADTAYMTEVVFPDLVKAGLLRDTRRDVLRLLALTEHVLEPGTALDPTNPGALFAHDLRLQLWYGTDANDLAAEKRLIAHERANAPPPPRSDAPPALSDDARFVEDVQRRLPPEWRDRPFLAVRMYDPTWTPERWDTACSELAQAQHHWQQVHALRRLTEVGIMEDWRVSAPDD